MHPHSSIWIVSGFLLYSLVSVNFKRTKFLIRLNDDNVLTWLRYRRNILLFIAKKNELINKKKIKKIIIKNKKRKEKRKNTMFTLNILTPYHTCPKNLTRSFIYLFTYLKLPDESHSVTTLLTPRSALGPHCMLRLRVNTVSANYNGI